MIRDVRPQTPDEDPVEDLIALARQLARTFEGMKGPGGGWSVLFPAVRFAEDYRSRVAALVKTCGDNPTALLEARSRLRRESSLDDVIAFKAQKLLWDAFFAAIEGEQRGDK